VDLGLIVPVYNEINRLGPFFEELVDWVDGRSGTAELIFVDDGSTDGTADELERLIADHRPSTHARVLRRPHSGKGGAVTAGLSASIAGIRAFCDLDLATPLEDLERIIARASRADLLAIASRDLSGSVVARPESRVREALGRLYNRLLQATVTPGVVDTQCGAKAASSGVWEVLLPRCHQTGFAWDAELVALALASGVVVQEVPVTWRHDPRSKVRVVRDGLGMVRQTPTIMRSARAATAATETMVTQDTSAPGEGGVFGDRNAALIESTDRTHWWFRSKAAYVATALVRTGAGEAAAGWLVDVGGGSGGVSRMLGWPPSRIAVIEGNEQLISTAVLRLGLTGVRASVPALPIADGAAEVVTLLDVIEHLPEPAAALSEARRLIRPGGRLVVSVPAHQWLWSAADVDLGHHRRYSRRGLRRELRDAGFSPVFTTHLFSWLVPPVWLVRRLRRSSDAELGLDRRSLLIDIASLVLTAIERAFIGRVSLPLGTSVLCVARPTGPAAPPTR